MRETATLRRGMLSLGPRHRIAALSSKMTTHERTCTGEGAAVWLEVRVPQPNAMDVQTGREMIRAVRAAPLAIGISAVVVPGGTAQPALTDQQIAAIIVKDSRDAYYQTGHPCACPEDLARNGSRRGRRSAYTRPVGAEPYCYATDVPKEKIGGYRAAAH
jgi:hypothetical protein